MICSILLYSSKWRSQVYKKGDLLAATLSFDIIRIRYTIEKIRAGEYNPRNQELRDRLRKGIEREIITIDEVNLAINSYHNEVKK
ncbi:MAG: hypothetical protein HY831_03355 [Candidatus Aenigmarchaeota archaeon]|nr:hypothetical protein [Candidatus Aenigmarchaeota archaeon]